MKRLLLILIVVLWQFNLNAQTWPPAGMLGDGSADSPWLIGTGGDLQALAAFVNASVQNANTTEDKHYRIINDIDLSKDLGTLERNPEGWNPIGTCTDVLGNHRRAFKGYMHGGGHIISNLRIHKHDHIKNIAKNFYAGLFGVIENATIDSLGVEVAQGDSVKGSNFIGILVGYAYTNNKISQCYTSGKVSGQLYVGGLVGSFSGGSIENCYSQADVYGISQHVGGLVGCLYYGSKVSYSYASGNVDGHWQVGGLIGKTRFGSAAIRNCVAANSLLAGEIDVCAVLGGVNKTNVAGHKNYALASTMATGHDLHDGIPALQSELQTTDFYTNYYYWEGGIWDFKTIWTIGDSSTYPVFRWQLKDTCIPFDNIVVTRWNNTLTVINNPENNGGYTFTSFAWYRNGEYIGNGQSWSAGNNGERIKSTDSYRVELTAQGLSRTLNTCESVLTLQSSSLSAYPNPVSKGQTVFVKTDLNHESLDDATLEMYNPEGRLIETWPASTAMEIPVLPNYSAGIYVVELKTKNGTRRRTKILVK
jgi:hypothetical protein